MLRSINPATETLLREFPLMSTAEANRVLRGATRAWEDGRRSEPGARAALLFAAADQLHARLDELARLITTEMGKPVREARAEIEKCARAFRHYAQHGAAMLADQPASLDEREAFVTFQPIGVVLAIMPWNFPFWQAVRAAAPTLLAGNTVVLKHASNVTGCALALGEIFQAAGFPAGAFSVLRLESRQMNRIIRHRAIAAVTLTGSTEAGRKVAAVAGSALKKTVLELGGSDAYVVLADADLELAARTCARARMVNGGQSCIAAKRFIVVEEVRAEFEERLVAEMQAYHAGDPLDESTNLGPLARPDLRESLHAQVQRSCAAGARRLCGGEVPAGVGAFYPATILTEVQPGMPAFDEELFGPVAAVVSAPDEPVALALANRSTFGLGGAVFTRDLARGRRIAREELAAGFCVVNDFVQSDPRVPFGGVKDSGYGRELGEFGIREFVNIKTVSIPAAGGA